MAIDSSHRVIIGNMSDYNFDWIFFILTRNKDTYSISDGFEYQPHRITDYGVRCPCVS